jgi:Periplasmic component of the Tol biopolymer transport system
MKNKLFIFIFFLITFPLKSLALIEVDITRGNLSPLPIAVSSLDSNEKDKKNIKKELNIEDIGLEISNVVENNLKKSGLFNPLNKEAFLQKPDIAHLKPKI